MLMVFIFSIVSLFDLAASLCFSLLVSGPTVADQRSARAGRPAGRAGPGRAEPGLAGLSRAWPGLDIKSRSRAGPGRA